MKTRPHLALAGSALTLLATACAQESTTTRVLEPESPALATTVPPSPPGTLVLCKVAGAGVVNGTVFTFDAVLAGVTRVAEVAAGGCLTLATPVERTPSSKGWYQRKTGDVARLVPSGTGLVVDAALLDAAQLTAILRGTGVQSSSSLLLNLVQQLIAADLNVLRGAQPTQEVSQAMATANAGVSIAEGPPLALSTSLTTAQMSGLVNTLTAFNEGKLTLPAAPPTMQLAVTERDDALSELQGIACAPSGSCTGIDLVTRSVTAATSSGQTTTVTYTNRGKPVLRICKVAGAGVTAGAVYLFTAGGINVADAAQANVAAGDCEDVELLEASYMLVESVPAGEAVQSIVCAPAAACTNTSLSVGQVKVAVVRGLTTVTYTNRSIVGTLRICKVAGAGVAAGTVFSFHAGGLDVNDTESYQVAAGACEDGQVEEGNYQINETIPAGVGVSAIACDPAAACSSVQVPFGQTAVTVAAASVTTVTYTNRSIIGALRICKVAGPGVLPGTVFAFSAAGINVNASQSYQVAAGGCQGIPMPEGNYTTAEVVPAGIAVSAIDCTPAQACSSPSLGVGQVTAAVTGGATTTITFTNRSTVATLRICKLTGLGGVYSFTAGGINVNDSESYAVPAGECRDGQLAEGIYMVTESVPAGSTVSDISCIPAAACSNISLSVGTLHVALTGATLTTVWFTNVPSASDEFAVQEVFGSDAWMKGARAFAEYMRHGVATASVRSASWISATRFGSLSTPRHLSATGRVRRAPWHPRNTPAPFGRAPARG